MTDKLSAERYIKKIQSISERLAAKAGLRTPVRLRTISSGHNNRLFRLDSGQSSYLLKSYFHDPIDPRDRLITEFSFTSFAWKYGLRNLPEPIAHDPTHALGLYEFIEGTKLKPDQVKWAHVQQALNFFQNLNQLKNKPEAEELPEASEAFFSVTGHIRCVDNRMNRLAKIEGSDRVTYEAKQFIEDELLPVWDKVKGDVLECAERFNLKLDSILPIGERCISPSDFGFHNAVMTKEGKIRFVDFEYAGWDDPAKTVCDFFCQPEIPVPMDNFTPFKKAVMKVSRNPETLAQRIDLLLAVYQVKWCCIILNDFLPVAGERRRYANTTDPLVRKTKQLHKVRSYLHQLLLGR